MSARRFSGLDIRTSPASCKRRRSRGWAPAPPAPAPTRPGPSCRGCPWSRESAVALSRIPTWSWGGLYRRTRERPGRRRYGVPMDPREVMTRPAAGPDLVVRYGDHPEHLLDVHLPPARSDAAPVVVFVHGGFWRQ